MDGSWDKLPSGLWRLRAIYKSEYTLKRTHISATGKTKGECREKLEQKIATLKAIERHSMANPTATLCEALKDWLKTNKFGKIKMSSYDRIERTITTVIQPYDISRMQTVEVRRKDILDYFEELNDADFSLSTRSKAYEVLHAFFANFYANDSDHNPMNQVEPLRQKRSVGEITVEDAEDIAMEDVVLSDAEIAAFKKWVFQEPRDGARGRSRFGVALYLMMMTCMRYGEAVSAVWGDINVERRELTVSKNLSRVANREYGAEKKTRVITTTPKSGKTRVVMLSKEALEALDWIKKRSAFTGKRDLVICTTTGAPPTNAQLARVLRGVLKAAKLDAPARDKAFTLHYLRHTGISYYIRNGIPLELVSQMAGHSSVGITERVYYHVIQDQRKKMVELMDSIGQKKDIG